MYEQATITIGGKVDGDLMDSQAWDNFRDEAENVLADQGFTIYVRNTGTGTWTEDGVTLSEPNYVLIGVNEARELEHNDLAYLDRWLTQQVATLAKRYEQSAIALGWRGKSYLVTPDGNAELDPQ